MPTLDCGPPVTQRLFRRLCRHRHAPDASTLALDRQQSRPLPRLHGSRIKTADLMDAQTDIKGERGNICIVSPANFPANRHEGRELLRRPVPVSPLKLSALQRRLIGQIRVGGQFIFSLPQLIMPEPNRRQLRLDGAGRLTVLLQVANVVNQMLAGDVG